MKQSLAVILGLVVVLSGCVGGGDDDDDSVAPAGTTTPGGGATSGGSPSPGSPATPSPGATGIPPQAGPPPPPPLVETHDGALVFRLRPPSGPMVDSPTNENVKFPLPMEGNITGYIMELTWNAATALTTNMGIYFHKGSSDLANADLQGTSPLRHAVNRADTSDGPYEVEVLPGSTGGGNNVRVAVNQAFTITIITFDGTPFDPAYVPTV